MRRLVCFLLAAAVYAIAHHRYDGAPPLGPEVGATVFSEARARSALATILGDGAPHPSGTPAAERVVERILEGLRARGVEAQVVEGHACGRYRTCGRVRNVVAEIGGSAPSGTLLVVAHHDSVAAGPGAADDGSGVAIVLEIGRALVARPPKNDVVLLITDGEERGLLGAEAFVRAARPSGREIVLNLEARGTSGPSTLFQTSRGSGGLIEHFARAPRPVGSSLHGLVYRLLPNDTDLSVFLDAGAAGLNLAFSEGAIRYHTAHDDLAHLDPRSLQHQGETATSLALSLSAVDLSMLVRGREVVWFDLFGAVVVRWPRALTLPLALFAAALLGVAIRRVGRAPREIASGAFRAAATPVVATIAGTLIWSAAHAFGVVDDFLGPRTWIERPAPILVALHVVAGISVVALRGRPSDDGLGALACTVTIAVALAIVAPEAAYLFVVPALVGTVIAVALSRDRDRDRARELVAGGAGVASIAVWALILRALYPGLGLSLGPVPSLGLSLALIPLSPLADALGARARGLLLSTAALATAIAMAWALLAR